MKTPQLPYPELGKAIGLSDVWLKREDQHHFGSHKGRSIPHMIDEYRKRGATHFVISSSGNAALAAGLAIQAHNLNNPSAEKIGLTICVGKNMPAEKLNRLRLIEDPNIRIRQEERPKQEAFRIEKTTKAIFLRQSKDDLALVGYRQLAEELNHIPNLQAIFIPTSSGTTAQGLGEASRTLSQQPQIHIVQSEACHPIANMLIDTDETLSTEASIASAIVDKIAYRKEKVANVVRESGGFAWIVSDDEIRAAIAITEKTTSQNISPNSALSVAGMAKAIRAGRTWQGAVVCLITGI